MTLTDPVTTAQHERAGEIRCATLGHAWHDYDSNWRPEFGTPLTVRCERCGRERRDAVNDRTGQLLNRHYWPAKPRLTYAKGQRPSRAEFRVMLLKQRMTEAREARKAAKAS